MATLMTNLTTAIGFATFVASTINYYWICWWLLLILWLFFCALASKSYFSQLHSCTKGTSHLDRNYVRFLWIGFWERKIQSFQYMSFPLFC
jgi:hypothetical protein